MDQSLLRIALDNSRRGVNDTFSDSDTKSRPDSDPGDDVGLDMRASDTWPSTSDPGDEGFAVPTAHLPGFVGGTADGLVT